jgi:hypothetical protein
MNLIAKLTAASMLVAPIYSIHAQDAVAAPQPPIVAIAQPAPSGTEVMLPPNTELLVSMNEELTSKGGKIDEGHTFRLSTVHDVKLGDHLVIPKGTPAVGEVTWLTGKGAFGKSGKMEVAVRYLDMNGRRIPLSGTYRQEGEGNTVATVAAIATVWVAAPFITGKSARIPQGRELKAFTKDALPVIIPAAAAGPAQAAPVAAPVMATPAVAPTPAQK